MTILSLPRALQDYDLKPPIEPFAVPFSQKNNLSLGIRTGAGDFIWKRYARLYDLQSIHYEHRLLTFLSREPLSFRVPVPIPTVSGALLCHDLEGLSSLVEQFPGHTLDPSRLDHAKLLGSTIGELQAALQRYPLEARPGNALFAMLFDFPPAHRSPLALTVKNLGLSHTAASEETLRFWQSEVARLVEFVQGPFQLLPWQLCHNDVAPANVLVDGDHVSALLDFEFATSAPKALDVAMGLRMTMRVWENEEPWHVIPHFFRGYRRWMPFDETEALALPELIALRSAIPVLWWQGRLTDNRDAEVILKGIEYLGNFRRWLRRHEKRFVCEVLRATAC